MNEKEYIVIKKPNLFISIAEDVFSFGGFMAVLWFNHAYLSGNGWIDFLFIVLWIMTAGAVQSRRYHKFTDKNKAIEFLKGLEQ